MTYCTVLITHGADAECWTKLRLWELEQYDRWAAAILASQHAARVGRASIGRVMYLCRLAYLDADMLILRNIDHLFELPPGFYAGEELEESVVRKQPGARW